MAEGQQQKTEDKRSEGKGGGRQYRKFRPMQEPKKKDPGAVPILKYGPNNNFMRFQEVLSKKALEEYGMLGKLILKGKIEDPVEPGKADFDLKDEYDKVAYLEELKLYRKLKNEQKERKPKLYATILKYLSKESLEAVRKANNWDKVEEEVNPARLWEIIVDKHRVHSTSEVAAIVKQEARNQLQNVRQGGFESVISYKQQYSNAIKAYHDQGNPTKDDADQAMDFFHGLVPKPKRWFVECLHGQGEYQLLLQCY
jgi:hypothetical protein